MIQFKAGCRLAGLQPQTVVAMQLAEQAYAYVGAPLVVTSVNDGTHKKDSFHYRGLAFDCRIKHVHPSMKPRVLGALDDLLRPLGFDVLWEAQGTDNEHVHVEYDPKEAGR